MFTRVLIFVHKYTDSYNRIFFFDLASVGVNSIAITASTISPLLTIRVCGVHAVGQWIVYGY